jgi:anaerobic ribonucleoside-triphosphate reductase activating protein
MYVARILYPVEVLGYGKRIGIWFVGCPHKCYNCSNPELWEFDKRYEISLANILCLIKDISTDNVVDGFTITGGEPFYQCEQLNELTTELIKISDDILIYSGYTIEQLHKLDKTSIESTLSQIAVLIDGKYIEAQNIGTILRGSVNQRIHIINNKHRDRYEIYLNNNAHAIQNFNTGDGIVSVGIHKPNFMVELNSKVSVKGLEEA